MGAGNLPVFSFDMDGVLADFMGGWHEWMVRHKSAHHWPPDKWDTDKWIWKFIETNGSYRSLDPLIPKHVFERINELRLIKRSPTPALVYFVTSRYTGGMQFTSHMDQTTSWLEHQGIPRPAVITSSPDKARLLKELGADFHIDDRPKTCIEVADAGIRSYCMAQQWNTSEPDRDRMEYAGVKIVHDIAYYLDDLEKFAREWKGK